MLIGFPCLQKVKGLAKYVVVAIGSEGLTLKDCMHESQTARDKKPRCDAFLIGRWTYFKLIYVQLAAGQ